jgi:DNA topoisomerase-2
MASKNESNLAQMYQKKTDKEHILHNPDTYIGSVDNIENDMHVYDGDKKIIQKNIMINPGLYKLFDEAIVNCRDHAVRMQTAMETCKPNIIPLSNIEVSITEDGTISMMNDGNGIDIAMHPEHKIWIPEMIFAHLRTGTNYNKEEKKIVGGKNGFGSKLIFIWSTYGKIETVDHIRKKKFTQEYFDNLDTKSEPIIKTCNIKPFTRITFKPDYKRLGLDGLSPDMIHLFIKRVYDISAITNKNIKVKYNSALIPIKTFQQYIDMYIGSKDESKRVYECYSDRWEYAVGISPTEEFSQISFVNGISTAKGGKHVEYIRDQIIRKIVKYIQVKKKIDVKPNTIKEQIILFLRCDIENPSFESQTKDYMSTPSNKFGSSCTVSDKFIEKIAKMGIMNTACELTAVKQQKDVKKSDGTKTKSIRGIPKLVDANKAGTNESHKCTIIFCEGDSAKAGIISGLVKEDREYIGVYPMKGKLFNVRGESIARIGENKEIVEIKQILGLETDKEYDSIEKVEKQLRYGKILFMTDQDLDGSHIKGLGINMFQTLWPSISKLNIIGFMNTPILKAKKGSQELIFYNDAEYDSWKLENNDGKGWKVKYYKGLGTSTSKEFKEYFKQKKEVYFSHTQDSDDAIDMVFNKKRSEDRKNWLGVYNRSNCLDTNHSNVSFEDFIHKEMKHFSKYDCDRSIPSGIDGMKTSQRKTLYAAFKKNLNTEIKVAQFSGYVSEHSGYHHGEASLNGTIVNMAQNYVGSNNINLFLPNGQFGTRLAGGKDSASERYIFTQLNKLTRYIFPEHDDKILKYLDDDGTMVEPIYYLPIIPMILVNGTKGIGTGFSTDIMCYNPIDIISYLKAKLNDSTYDKELIPYYEGFKGTVTKISDTKYLIKGVYEKLDANTIRILELPIGVWTDDYKKFLESLVDNKKGKKNGFVKDFTEICTDKNVDIKITLHNGRLSELESSTAEFECNGVEKYFKLYTTNTRTNMHLFDENEQLKLYKSAEEIIEAYYTIRYQMYEKRKQYLIQKHETELVVLSNKAKYITELLNGTIDLRRMKKEAILHMLSEKKYNVIDNDSDYKYLVKMPMDSVSQENVEKLLKEKGDKELELMILKSTTIQKMWADELELLETAYKEYQKQRAAAMMELVVKKTIKKKKIIKH